MRRMLSLVLVLLSASIALGQTGQSDARVLEAILEELRSMHSEMQIQEARNETMQILLFELQSQQSALAKATQRADDARAKVAEIQDLIRHTTADISRLENQQKISTDEKEKKFIEVEIERSKANLTSFKSGEQDRLLREEQANQLLRKAQDALDVIQGDLDKLMQDLRKTQQQASTK